MTTGLWVGLVMCNLIWAANPTAAKFVLNDVGPYHTAWLRYASAWLAFLLLDREFIIPRARKDAFFLVTMAVTTFLISPLCQMNGLSASSAINNALLVAIEPIVTAVLAWAVLKEKLHPSLAFSFFLAMGGLSLIMRASPGAPLTKSAFRAELGEIALVVAVAGEAAYSVFARKLSRLYSPAGVFGSAISLGLFFLSCVVFLRQGVPNFAALSWEGWMGVLWLGPIGTTATYLFWLRALKHDLPLATIAVTLFLQPTLGTLAGMLFLGEAMALGQLVGAALLLCAVFVQIYFERKSLDRLQTEQGLWT